MDKDTSAIQKRRRTPFIILLYLVAFGIIIFVFPRKGKFSYEFSVGRPWLQSELYAPYDIPLLKTESEIQKEKDSLIRFSPYYFRWDEEAYDRGSKELARLFSEYLEHLQSSGKEKNVLLSQALEQGMKPFRDIYETGIIQLNEEIEEKLIKSDSSSIHLRVIRNNIGEYAELSDFYSQKSAFTKIREALKNKPLWENFLNATNIADLLTPNILYDQEATLNIRTESVKNISLTKGIWPAGKLIVSRGETVNREKFIILNSFREEFENRTGFSEETSQIIIGQASVILLILSILFFFFRFYEPFIFYNFKKHGFIIMMVTVTVVFSALVSHSEKIHLYIVPFTLLAIILQTFYSSKVTATSYAATILLVGFFAPAAFEFIILNYVAGATAIYSANGLYRRNILFRNVILIFIAYSVTFLAMFLLQDGNIEKFNFDYLVWFALSAGFSLLTYTLIFIIEKIFGFLSDVRLMELIDTNQPLLRQLSENAPGTFQHSLQISNIAEEVIRHIGGNPLLVRAGAMYHDIGKIKQPQYFIENVSGENPHEHLSIEESTAIILKHVTDGIEIAQKHRLPTQIIDFIQTHHGTSVVQFFYKTYTHQNPGVEVDIRKFSYKGPNPFSKEMVVLMMCDACEAASHSLTEKNSDTIHEMVDKIIDYQMKNESYMDADITFRSVTQAGEIIKKKLMNIYHVRIAYPQ